MLGRIYDRHDDRPVNRRRNENIRFQIFILVQSFDRWSFDDLQLIVIAAITFNHIIWVSKFNWNDFAFSQLIGAVKYNWEFFIVRKTLRQCSTSFVKKKLHFMDTTLLMLKTSKDKSLIHGNQIFRCIIEICWWATTQIQMAFNNSSKFRNLNLQKKTCNYFRIINLFFCCWFFAQCFSSSSENVYSEAHS